MAAQLTVKTLGADADMVQDWFRSPEKMIQLIAAAEGVARRAGRDPAAGTGTGSGTGISGLGRQWTTGAVGWFRRRPGCGSWIRSRRARRRRIGGRVEPARLRAASQSAKRICRRLAAAATIANALPQFGEAEMQSLLRLLAQFGEAAHGNESRSADPIRWLGSMNLAALPQNAQVTLRQALATVAAKTPSAKVDEAMLLRLAEDLAIRFALDRFQRGEVRVNAVRQMLDKMGQELGTLRKAAEGARRQNGQRGTVRRIARGRARPPILGAVPESGKRAVLTSTEAWCIPPRNVQQYVEELLGRGEADAAGDVLLKYASCVRNKDAEARKKAAIGLGQLAELYSKAASQRLQDALAQIGQQLAAEKDAELQTLLSAAFVRLSQEAALAALLPRDAAGARFAGGSRRTASGVGAEPAPATRSRKSHLGIHRRSADGRGDARRTCRRADARSAGRGRTSGGAAGALGPAHRARKHRRSWRRQCGSACARHLKEVLKSEPPAKAASVVGLLSRLDPSGRGRSAAAATAPRRARVSRCGRAPAFDCRSARARTIAGEFDRSCSTRWCCRWRWTKSGCAAITDDRAEAVAARRGRNSAAGLGVSARESDRGAGTHARDRPPRAICGGSSRRARRSAGPIPRRFAPPPRRR